MKIEHVAMYVNEMAAKEKAFFNWSSGKDSALALLKAINSGKYDICSLFSVVLKKEQMVAMHNISLDLLKKQAEAIQIPLIILENDWENPAGRYQNAMAEQMKSFREEGIRTALYGDIYLESIRKQRENNCRISGMNAAFPLWGEDPKDLIKEFVDLGFKSIITSVNSSVLDESYIGRIIDSDFIRDFPENADICGENGEYHSFVFDGPIFQRPVEYTIAGKHCEDYKALDGVSQVRYWYLELV